VLLGQAVGLGPRLDRLARYFLCDESLGGLFSGGKLGVPPELDGLVGSAGVGRRRHR
jgi:hypothetical protein